MKAEMKEEELKVVVLEERQDGRMTEEEKNPSIEKRERLRAGQVTRSTAVM